MVEIVLLQVDELIGIRCQEPSTLSKQAVNVGNQANMSLYLIILIDYHLPLF